MPSTRRMPLAGALCGLVCDQVLERAQRADPAAEQPSGDQGGRQREDEEGGGDP